LRNDFIIDFETFGKDAQKCAVIDCSVMVFNWDKMLSNDPYTTRDINLTRRFKLSVMDQVKNYGYEIDKDTVSFWEEQSPEVRRHISPKDGDLTVEEFCKDFQNFLINSPKIDFWWSRSNTFDPIILGRLFQSQDKLLHMEEYLKYWRVRDTRTFIDAKLNFPKKNGFNPLADEALWESSFKAHDSSWDILADVLRIQAITRAENDMEQV
jgi:hypothetical protein